MSALIEDFNITIKNYIEECVRTGMVIPVYDESYLLTEGKVVTIYNQMQKERKKIGTSFDPDELKELLRKLEEKYYYFGNVVNFVLPDNLSWDATLENTKNAFFNYYNSKQNAVQKCWEMGYILCDLKEKHRKLKARENWQIFLEKFLEQNNIKKMKSTCEQNLRKFCKDIGVYQKLLYTTESYTELRRLLPKILAAFEMYPHEKDKWKYDLRSPPASIDVKMI